MTFREVISAQCPIAVPAIASMQTEPILTMLAQAMEALLVLFWLIINYYGMLLTVVVLAGRFVPGFCHRTPAAKRIAHYVWPIPGQSCAARVSLKLLLDNVAI